MIKMLVYDKCVMNLGQWTLRNPVKYDDKIQAVST